MAVMAARKDPKLRYIETNWFDLCHMVDRASPDHQNMSDSFMARAWPFGVMLRAKRPMLETKQYMAFEAIDMLPTGSKNFSDL